MRRQQRDPLVQPTRHSADEGRRIIPADKGIEIAADAEIAPLRPDQHGAQRRVGGGLRHQGGEGVDQRHVHRVADVGAGKRDGGKPIGHVEANGGGGSGGGFCHLFLTG